MKELIYGLSPIALQNWMITAYGRSLYRQRYGKEYFNFRKNYLEKNYGDRAAECQFQLEELRRLIDFASKNSQFYSKLLDGFDPRVDLNSISDIARLPIVSKEDIRNNISDIYTIKPKDGISAFTGGTTGKSLQVYFTRSDFQKRMAYLDAFKIRCGVDPFTSRKATFSGRSFARGIFQKGKRIFWRDNLAYSQRLYSTFDMQEENLAYYISDLNKYKPEILNGFVSAIHQLARYIIDNRIEIKFKPVAIFTTSETLLPHHREAIQSAFGTRVYNQYASAEGAPFITECIAGGLHYNIDTGVIELEDFGLGPEMVVTSFTSYGTPLIRYRIGDALEWGDGECPCGSSHPLVKEISGRRVDYLSSPSRGRISLSHLADVIKGLPNCVREMQFIQISPSVLNVLIAVDQNLWDKSMQKTILSSLAYRFGQDMEITFEVVEQIPRESSGKFRLIKNEITK